MEYRKMGREKEPPLNLTWGPRGLNSALHRALHNSLDLAVESVSSGFFGAECPIENRGNPYDSTIGGGDDIRRITLVYRGNPSTNRNVLYYFIHRYLYSASHGVSQTKELSV